MLSTRDNVFKTRVGIYQKKREKKKKQKKIRDWSRLIFGKSNSHNIITVKKHICLKNVAGLKFIKSHAHPQVSTSSLISDIFIIYLISVTVITSQTLCLLPSDRQLNPDVQWFLSKKKIKKQRNIFSIDNEIWNIFYFLLDNYYTKKLRW